MCFSAPVSFTSGILLIVIGAFALRQVRSKKSIPFALIPIFFGVQQVIEWVVWISFDSPRIHSIAVYGFLLFSHVFWPIYVPISIGLLEQNPLRKKIIAGIAVGGIVISGLLFSGLFIGPVTCSIAGNSIDYQTPVYLSPILSFWLYLLATCGASMFSSSRKIQIFGSTMLGAFFVAHSFYPQTLYSVWCFFAAVLSVIIYIHMRDLRKLKELVLEEQKSLISKLQ